MRFRILQRYGWALGSLILLSCVQRGEFRTFQMEVNRDLFQQDKRIKEIQGQLKSIQERMDALIADRSQLGKQLADHMNDFTLLQEELARLRGRIEAFEHRQTGSASQQIAMLKERIAQLESKKPAEAVAKKPALAPKPRKPTPDEEAEAIYREARFRFEEGQYQKAREGFANLLKRHPNSTLADNAQFWIAECFFRERNFKRAILEYEKLITQYPRSTKIPAALFKQGMSFERLEDKESARYLYQKIAKEYPDSDQAPMAEHRLQKLP